MDFAEQYFQMRNTMKTQRVETPIRVGIFDSPLEVDHAIQDLMEEGFTTEEITVICPRDLEGRFAPFEHQKEKAEKNLSAAITGGLIGALLGGIVAFSGLVPTEGVSLFGISFLFIGTGIIVGGFVGLMMRRGIDKELAHFYDQGVKTGKILVAAQTHEKDQVEKLARAEDILCSSGVMPLKMVEG